MVAQLPPMFETPLAVIASERADRLVHELLMAIAVANLREPSRTVTAAGMFMVGGHLQRET